MSLAVWPDGRIKGTPVAPKVAKNIDKLVFTLKGMLFKMPKQFSKYLCYFYKKNCGQGISKIAQSGHTGLTSMVVNSTLLIAI